MVQTELGECLRVIAAVIGYIAPCTVQGSRLKNYQSDVMMVCASQVRGCHLLCGVHRLITNRPLMNVMHVAHSWCASVSC
jgi:hypothetical protein